MKYTKEQRLDIGRQVYYGEISKYQAAELYDIGPQTARDYMRLYRNENHLPPRRCHNASNDSRYVRLNDLSEADSLEAYEAMSKDELIQELVKARIAEARLKKGYEVKGDGRNKEFISLSSKNSKS